MANKIGRDKSFIGVLDDALVLFLAGSLDGFLDFIVRRTLLEADNEINDGDIKGWYTEGETSE